MAIDLLLICAGVLLIAVILLDVFQTLFNPLRGGSLSHRLLNVVWRHTAGFRRNHQQLRSLTGSLFILSVILFWVFFMIIGWALIYRAYLPEDGLLLTPGLEPNDQAGFVDALYISGVMLVTLGLGDITPTSDLLRVLVPVEGGIGFVLLTAGITWVLGIYPALARQQQLSQFLDVLERQLGRQGFAARELDQSEIPSIARDLAQQILVVRSDLLQFPIISFFHSSDPRSDLARTIHYLPHLLASFPAEEGTPHYEASRGLLRLASMDLADTFRSELLGTPDERMEVFESYAEKTGTTTRQFRMDGNSEPE